MVAEPEEETRSTKSPEAMACVELEAMADGLEEDKAAERCFTGRKGEGNGGGN